MHTGAEERGKGKGKWERRAGASPDDALPLTILLYFEV